MDEQFAAGDRRILSLLRAQGFSPACMYDIGASDGAWTRAVSDIFPLAHVELFEPLAELNEPYTAPMHLLVESDKRFHLNAVAVGLEPGKCEIHIFPNAVGSTTIGLQHVPDDVRTVVVEKVAVDDLILNRGYDIPQLIKMDIQGGELDALKGAARTLPHVDALLLETWITRGYGSNTPLLGELVDFLRKYGFFVYDFGDEFRNVDGVLVSKDCLFVNARSSISPLYEQRSVTS